MLTSIEACNMLRASKTVLESDLEKCSYIPLVNLRIEKATFKNLLRELNDNIKNAKFSVDFDKHVDYDTYSAPQNIYVKSSEKTKSHSDSQRSESRNGFPAINGSLPPLHNPDRQKGIIKEWTNTRIEREIYTSIKYSYWRALIVWCPTLDFESESVHAWLKKSTVYMYDRWIRKDMHKATDAWGGVVAMYPDRITAKKAAEEIPEQHE